jgi:hypothetical protein
MRHRIPGEDGTYSCQQHPKKGEGTAFLLKRHSHFPLRTKCQKKGGEEAHQNGEGKNFY